MINQLFKANHIFKQMLFQLNEFVIITSFDLNNKKKQTKQDENKQNKKQNTIFCKEIHLLQVRILPKNKIAIKSQKFIL